MHLKKLKILILIVFPLVQLYGSGNNFFGNDGLCWYPENFESTDSVFPPEGWKMTDADGDMHNWFLYKSIDENFNYAHSGNGFAASASWINQIALFPDNHLISPPVFITSQNNMLSFWIAAQDPEYSAEQFSVRIISADSNLQFNDTVVWSETLTSSIWSERKIRLTQFGGKSIRIDFRHHNCTNMFWLKLDDVNLLPFVNHAPEFITYPSYSIGSNGYYYLLKAIDEDNDVINYKAIQMESSFSLNPAPDCGAVITGFCPGNGTPYFEIEATDGELSDIQFWGIYNCYDNIESINIKNVNIVPNPATNFIQLAGIAVCDLKITGLCGNKYLDLKNIKENEKIDVSGLTDGLYLITINSVNHVTTLKLNIEH